MNTILSYFDLTHGLAERRAAAPAMVERPPVLPQYLALAAGVAAETLLRRSIAGEPPGAGLGAAAAQIALGLAVALAIFPAVYRNAFDPERPILVQLFAIFAAGIGWQSLLQAATGAGR